MGTKSMETVRQAFDEWQKQRGGRRTKVPEELSQMAVGLVARYRTQEICDGLSISRSNLLRWRKQMRALPIKAVRGRPRLVKPLRVEKTPRIKFLDVGTTQVGIKSNSQKTIEWENSDGKRMRISGAMSLDEIQSLAERFLNSGCGGNL